MSHNYNHLKYHIKKVTVSKSAKYLIMRDEKSHV